MLESETLLAANIGIGGNRRKSISKIDRFYQAGRPFGGLCHRGALSISFASPDATGFADI